MVWPETKSKHKPRFTTAFQKSFQHLLYAPHAASSWILNSPQALPSHTFCHHCLWSQVPVVSGPFSPSSGTTPELLSPGCLSFPQGRGPQAQHLSHLCSLLI
ncbi:unnamed protein product [Rangifer tarandus platyrhynchus]|uniref:Uncharacterized protein n=2 Tax=Rangifer tarandus platyrhynchus TaxID=3082113 RepID=A0AC59YUI4_RANTA|nr:unnamed protein product [Rangifer tarandus platyrhynchus]